MEKFKLKKTSLRSLLNYINPNNIVLTSISCQNNYKKK